MELEDLDGEDLKLVQEMLRKHQDFTGSTVAENILKNWEKISKQFVKVMPVDYKKALQAQKEGKTPAAVA